MAKIDPRLKSLFTSFNLFFSVVGVLTLCLGLWNDTWQHTDFQLIREVVLLALYMLGTFTLIISLLGAYGAHHENKLALGMFLVFMITGSIVMLSAGVTAAVARPQMVAQMEEVFKAAVPLDKTVQSNKNSVNAIQRALHCCGLFSYHDWQDHFPASCLCNPREMEGRCIPATYYSPPISTTIYPQPCFPIMVSYLNLFVDFTLGMSFTLTIMAVLGMVLSCTMIHQMRDVAEPNMVLKLPAAFAPKLPKYQELFNTP